ncbi:hypothetical protein J4526_01445 [Desulfurococcaceae archaeon MEX13E-LK6-19]|nr:hypothetical protein J4526_01445 [Desulfurococcaceae archaeon MEX13E-LK6-19]
MGKVKNKPIALKAFLVDRKTTKIVTSRSFRNRIPLYLYIKLAAWIFAIKDEYPSDKYKLIVHIEGDENDPRVRFLEEQLSKSNIEIYIAREVIKSVV